MSDIFERKPKVSDEVSAIELAAICVKRRALLLTVFSCFFVTVLAYALIEERKYEFKSLYSLTTWADDRYVVDPNSIITLLNGKIWPELKTSNEVNDSEPLSFEVSIDKISDTSLIRITSVSGKGNAKEIERIHKLLLSTLRQNERDKETSLVNSLNERVSELEAYAEEVRQGNVGRTEMAPIYEKLMDIKQNIDSVSAGGVRILAAQSSTPVDMSRTTLILVGLLGGIIFGVISTFVAEFGFRVRIHLRNAQDFSAQ